MDPYNKAATPLETTILCSFGCEWLKLILFLFRFHTSKNGEGLSGTCQRCLVKWSLFQFLFLSPERISQLCVRELQVTENNNVICLGLSGCVNST
jgi:hypothetical protein